jgi:murein DD-endopeptidase MepM/ murein hydrolase activator NlpD
VRALASAAVALALACACANRPPLVHTVERGENVYRIAGWYRVPVGEVLRANGLDDPRALRPGQKLLIPNAERGAPPGPLLPPAGVRPSEGSPLERPRSQFDGLGELRPNALARMRARAQARLSGNVFAWPLEGSVSSGFGSRNGNPHEGIDILADPGTPIRAAEAGRATFSGTLGAYGNVVILRHDGRFVTVYAHTLRNLVERGARVRRGQVIAEVGASGNASGPHLHFEIRRDERSRNPLLYLPAEP